MHYGTEEIRELAKTQGDVKDGWTNVSVVLAPGDTAFAPGTTKYVLRAWGDARVMYEIAPDGGWAGFTQGQVGRSLIS